MQTNIRTNVIVNIIRTITMTILSFITFPLVCRVLGDSVLGAYAWATSFVYYFLILARISIPNIAVRECIKVKNDPEKLSQKVQEFFIMQAVMTLLSFILMMVIVFSVPALREPITDGVNSYGGKDTLIFLLSLNFLTGVFSFEWLYTTLEKHIYMAIRSIVILAIVDILIFLLVSRPANIQIYGLLANSTTILIVLSNLIFLPRLLKGKVKFSKHTPYNFKQYGKTLFVLFIISAFVAIYDKTDTFILGLIDNTASVGSYAVAMKGIEIVIGIILSLGTVFMPRASEYFANKDMAKFASLNRYSTNICLFITIPAIATMATMATPITNLIGGLEGYDNANLVLIGLSSLMLTFSMCDIIYTQILIPIKKEKYYMITMAIGCALNIALSLLFGLVVFKDPGMRAIGVSIATAISDLIILVILFAFTWKHSKKILLDTNNIKIIVVGALIGVFAYFVGNALFNAFNEKIGTQSAYILELVLVVLLGAIIYISILLLLKERLLTSTIHRLKSKNKN